MKLKVKAVCSQPCGQRRIFGRFRKLQKTRKCPCVKGFRRFGSGRSDGCRYAPKPRALPSELHPVMKLKVKAVCSQPCGQRRIFGRFRKLQKTRKCPCVKGFRRFGSGRSDGCRYAPKPRALPSELHPVMKLGSGAGPEICGIIITDMAGKSKGKIRGENFQPPGGLPRSGMVGYNGRKELNKGVSR